MDKAITEQLVRWRVWNIVDGKPIKTAVSPLVKRRLIIEKGLCRISELPDNKAIVINGNNQWRMTTYGSPDWHHKSDSDEFSNDTGIHFVFDDKVSNRMTETSKKEPKQNDIHVKSNKDSRKMIFEKALILSNEEVQTHNDLLKKLKIVFGNNEDVMNILNGFKDGNTFGISFNRYKNRN
jgi:hypothetical protein